MPLCHPRSTLGGKTWWNLHKENNFFLLQHHKTGLSLWWGFPYRILLKHNGYLIAEAQSKAEIEADWESAVQLVKRQFGAAIDNGSFAADQLLPFFTKLSSQPVAKPTHPPAAPETDRPTVGPPEAAVHTVGGAGGAGSPDDADGRPAATPKELLGDVDASLRRSLSLGASDSADSGVAGADVIGGHALASVLYASKLLCDLEEEHERISGPADFDSDATADVDAVDLHRSVTQRVLHRHSVEFDGAASTVNDDDASTPGPPQQAGAGEILSTSQQVLPPPRPEQRRRVRELLQLPRDEETIAEFECFLMRDLLVAGRLLLTRNFLCFYDDRALRSPTVRLESYFHKSGRLKWNRRWCVLTNEKLEYFEDAASEHRVYPIGTISMAEVTAVHEEDKFDGRAHCLLIETPDKSHLFHADTASQLHQWFEAVKEAMSVAHNVVRVPWSSVWGVRMERDVIVVPKAISVTADAHKYLFSSFAQHAAAFDAIGNAFRAAVPNVIADGRALSAPHAQLLQSNILGSDLGDSKLAPAPAAAVPAERPRSGEVESEWVIVSKEDPFQEHSTHGDKLRHKFMKDFKLPNDTIIDYFRCSIVRTFPVPGRVYVTDRHLCFRAKVAGIKSHAQIPWASVRALRREASMWIMPSAITVTTANHQEITFTNFLSRDRAFATMTQQLEATRSLPPDPSSIADSVRLESFPVVSAPPSGRSLRVTILTIGSRGDVQPYLALGLGLQKAGHTVTIATHECFREFVTEYNLGFFCLGGDPRELMELCVANGMFTPKFIREALGKFRGFVDTILENCLLACRNADAIIAAPTTMCSYHVAEKLQLPLFGTFTMPFTRTRAYPNPFANPETPLGGAYNYMTHMLIETVFWQPIRGQINSFRVRNGMPPIPLSSGDPFHQKRVPYLYCFSPSVVPKPPDWGDEVVVAGYWFLDAPISWKPSDELLKFISSGPEPLVYVGFGSIIVDDPDKLTRTVIDAVKLAGVRCILVKGWGGLGRVEIPPTVLQLPSIPHDWLFPQVRCVVHHGGAGTTAAGIRVGVPTVIVPFFGDQGFWGQRIVDLGAGACLNSRTLTAERLAEAIKTCVHSASVRDRAAQLGRQIRNEDGVGRAVQAFHTYLGNAYIPPSPKPVWSTDTCSSCRGSLGMVRSNVGVNCRACGNVFCARCCSRDMPIPKYFFEQPVRVCDACVSSLAEESRPR